MHLVNGAMGNAPEIYKLFTSNGVKNVSNGAKHPKIRRKFIKHKKNIREYVNTRFFVRTYFIRMLRLKFVENLRMS